MFTGKRPWHPLTESNIMVKVHIKGDQKKPPYPSTNISDEAVDFLNKCLEFDPNNRWIAERLLEHPFVKIPVNQDKYNSIESTL
jgi:serine/threonine protein kinase